MKYINMMKLEISCRSVNEGYARTAVAAFAAQLDPTLEELNDIKTAVSEAVTNAIIHAYPDKIGTVRITVQLFDGGVDIAIKDAGRGIPDIKQAMEPLFTTGGDDRSGLGFTVMQSLMDKLRVVSRVGKGTTVRMRKLVPPRPLRRI